MKPIQVIYNSDGSITTIYPEKIKEADLSHESDSIIQPDIDNINQEEEEKEEKSEEKMIPRDSENTDTIEEKSEELFQKVNKARKRKK